MNYKILAITVFIILLSNPSLAQTGNFSETNSYNWLNQTIAKWDKGIIDNSIALLALLNKNYDGKQGINNIKAAEDTQGCWPKGNCDVKTSAFATLALGKAGQDVSKEIKWLKESQIAATAGGTYYLQIISGTEGNCEVSCSGSTVKKTIKANSDWVDANIICSGITTSLSKSMDVDCTNLGSVIISLIYNVKSSEGTDVYYIGEESQESKAVLSTHNACLPAKKGQTTCNYEATEYATWVMSDLGKEDLDTLNYLQSNIRANVIDYSLLYLITKNVVYTDWLKEKQKPSGSLQDDVKGTAFAVLALKQSTADYAYYNNATIWLEKKRSDDYSWNNDVFNTAIVLIALYGKLEQVAVSGVSGCTTNAECPLGKYCDNTTKVCLTKEVTCVKNEDCASGEVCDTITKTCKSAVAVSCTTNAECSFGQVCSNGECVQQELGCASDNDCASGEVCDISTGQCISQLEEGCTIDSDCASNEQCLNNQCIAKEKKSIAGIVIGIIIVILVLALLFLLYYAKYIKKGKGFKDFTGDIKNLFKKKPKKPSFEEFLKVQPREEIKQPLLPERPPKRIKYEGKIEDELEKSIREAERILHGK